MRLRGRRVGDLDSVRVLSSGALVRVPLADTLDKTPSAIPPKNQKSPWVDRGAIGGQLGRGRLGSSLP